MPRIHLLPAPRPRPSPERAAAPGGCRRSWLRLTAGLFAAAALGLPGGWAQRSERPPPRYLQLSPPDPAEGRRILEEFRRQGLAGDYFLEFALDVIPRQGAERVLTGRLWGSRNAAGPVARVSIRPETGSPAPEVRLLVQGGPHPALWEWRPGAAAAAPAGAAGLFAPVAGTDLTAFDLQMPFLYWPDFAYEGLTRMHGRPAHVFLLYPPAEIAARRPELAGVRVYLDTQYTALVEAEMIGPGGRPLRSLSVLDLKKVGGQWIVKTIDVRDEATRNKTRFEVTAAALDQRFPAATWEPAGLAGEAPVPAAPALARLAP